MIEISFPFRDTFLLSPRTANYIAALSREGDKFDYSRWLQRVREEENQAKRAPAAFTSGELRAAAELGNRITTSGCRDGWPILRPTPMTRAAPLPRAVFRSHHEIRNKPPKAGLSRRLETVRDAWDDFQANRARNAVYEYLEAVFAIVEHYKVRRRTKRLLRHAFEFANLPFDKNADPFTAVIRSTCDDNVDSKTISKWARALRYVARCKAPGTRLEIFMKDAGGVNACADGYARYFRQGGR
jgi:hypothetical protein